MYWFVKPIPYWAPRDHQAWFRKKSGKVPGLIQSLIISNTGLLREHSRVDLWGLRVLGHSVLSTTMMSILTLLRKTQDLGSALPRKTQVLASLCPEMSQVLAPLPKSWHLSAMTWPLENLWIRPDGLWGFGTGLQLLSYFINLIYNSMQKL